MHLDSKRDARAVRQPVRTAGDVYNAFDGITYGKGAAVLRMVEAWVGDEVFREAVRAYLDEHAYGSGGTAELLSELDRASGEAVSAVVRGFVDRPGTPLVTAELVCDEESIWPATLRVSQRRYLPAGRSDGSEPWRFPLCVRWESGGGNGHGGPAEESRACFTVEAAHHDLRLPTQRCPSWVHPNADEVGYYRWGLPEADLLALMRDHRANLSLRERIALPGGLRALLEAGEIPVETYLEGLLALSADPHRRVVEAIVPGLNGLARAVPDGDREAYARYVRRVLGPHLERIGLAPRDGEPRDAAQLRSRIVPTLADEGRDPAIRARARRVADAFLDGDAAAYTAEEIRVFLPMASWDADAAHWERLHAALRATDSPTLRRNLLSALGAFEDPALVRRSLALVLDGSLRAGDWRTVASSIRREALPDAWAFVRENHDALVARLGPVAASHLPGLASGFCTRAERDAVERFFRAQPPLPGRQRNLELALEDVERCAEARETLEEPLGRWLAALPD
jgi:alanyl aminopeptidase